jgi:small subunit ribosomal protein S3
MAVGETSGAGTAAGQRRVVSSSAASRRRGEPAPAAGPEEQQEENEPLIKEADPELERLLAEEEEIERRVTDHHETPHFRPGDE